MYYIYVLKSKIAKKSYTGYTSNLEKRILEHNNGRGTFSKKYKPWVLVHQEQFQDEKSAIKREKYLKSHSGRRFLKNKVFT